MASPNPYIVAYFSSGGRRQVSVFANTAAKRSFITYLESIDGVVSLIGGTVYNMPVN